MNTYLKLLRKILDCGELRCNRTGVDTRSVFGHQMRFDLRNTFPLLTTKRMHWASIVHELLWFINGSTNIAYLKKHGVKIWDKWADEQGSLGPIYGKQWRAWEVGNGQVIDQLQNVINGIKINPYSRRHIVTAWNPGDIDEMALPPCHMMFQFYVSNDNELLCHLYQRSADVFLGVPFNIASYSLLTMMVAQCCNLKATELIHTLGDAHLYVNHLEQARLQLARVPYNLPTVALSPDITQIDDFKYEDIIVKNYAPYPAIKAPIAI